MVQGSLCLQRVSLTAVKSSEHNDKYPSFPQRTVHVQKVLLQLHSLKTYMLHSGIYAIAQFFQILFALKLKSNRQV